MKNILNKGAKIATPPNPKEILYINQQRKNLESSLAVAALENIIFSDIYNLEELHQTMLESPNDDFYHITVEYHH